MLKLSRNSCLVVFFTWSLAGASGTALAADSKSDAQKRRLALEQLRARTAGYSKTAINARPVQRPTVPARATPAPSPSRPPALANTQKRQAAPAPGEPSLQTLISNYNANRAATVKPPLKLTYPTPPASGTAATPGKLRTLDSTAAALSGGASGSGIAHQAVQATQAHQATQSSQPKSSNGGVYFPQGAPSYSSGGVTYFGGVPYSPGKRDGQVGGVTYLGGERPVSSKGGVTTFSKDIGAPIRPTTMSEQATAGPQPFDPLTQTDKDLEHVWVTHDSQGNRITVSRDKFGNYSDPLNWGPDGTPAKQPPNGGTQPVVDGGEVNFGLSGVTPSDKASRQKPDMPQLDFSNQETPAQETARRRAEAQSFLGAVKRTANTKGLANPTVDTTEGSGGIPADNSTPQPLPKGTFVSVTDPITGETRTLTAADLKTQQPQGTFIESTDQHSGKTTRISEADLKAERARERQAGDSVTVTDPENGQSRTITTEDVKQARDNGSWVTTTDIDTGATRTITSSDLQQQKAMRAQNGGDTAETVDPTTNKRVIVTSKDVKNSLNQGTYIESTDLNTGASRRLTDEFSQGTRTKLAPPPPATVEPVSPSPETAKVESAPVAPDGSSADSGAPAAAMPGDLNLSGGHTFDRGGTTKKQSDEANRPPTKEELIAAKTENGNGPENGYDQRETETRAGMKQVGVERDVWVRTAPERAKLAANPKSDKAVHYSPAKRAQLTDELAQLKAFLAKAQKESDKPIDFKQLGSDLYWKGVSTTIADKLTDHQKLQVLQERIASIQADLDQDAGQGFMSDKAALDAKIAQLQSDRNAFAANAPDWLKGAAGEVWDLAHSDSLNDAVRMRARRDWGADANSWVPVENVHDTIYQKRDDLRQRIAKGEKGLEGYLQIAEDQVNAYEKTKSMLVAANHSLLPMYQQANSIKGQIADAKAKGASAEDIYILQQSLEGLQGKIKTNEDFISAFQDNPAKSVNELNDAAWQMISEEMANQMKGLRAGGVGGAVADMGSKAAAERLGNSEAVSGVNPKTADIYSQAKAQSPSGVEVAPGYNTATPTPVSTMTLNVPTPSAPAVNTGGSPSGPAAGRSAPESNQAESEATPAESSGGDMVVSSGGRNSEFKQGGVHEALPADAGTTPLPQTQTRAPVAAGTSGPAPGPNPPEFAGADATSTSPAGDPSSSGSKPADLSQGGTWDALPPKDGKVRYGVNPKDPSRGVLFNAKKPPGVDPNPPQRQGRKECGPTALANAANNLNLNVSKDEVVALARNGEAGGFDPDTGMNYKQAVQVADKLGLSPSVETFSSPSDLAALHAQGKQTMIMIENAEGGSHWVVVEKVDNAGNLTVNDPSTGKRHVQKFTDFYQQTKGGSEINGASPAHDGLGVVTPQKQLGIMNASSDPFGYAVTLKAPGAP